MAKTAAKVLTNLVNSVGDVLEDEIAQLKVRESLGIPATHDDTADLIQRIVTAMKEELER